MNRNAQFAIGVGAGGFTAALWLASEFVVPWEARLPFLYVPAAVLGALLTIGSLRRQFAALLGYLVGLVPAVALHLLVILAFGVSQAWQAIDAFADRIQARPFEAQAWRQHPDDRTRAHMVDDLVRSRRLIGLPLPKAQALLGPPSNNLGGSECDLAYWLNTNRGWLCLTATSGLIEDAHFREYDD